MSPELEHLLSKLEGLAPRFGRVSGDVSLMLTRGRMGDFKGVMQNARLVLEALLRSLITDELKQTPGKAMLDELVSKFRQQANAGVIPPNLLAHMGTVQAWGNLSAHDHAGSLDDAPVVVGEAEVIASLNSMVAILTWYAERRQLAVSVTAAPTSTTSSRPATPLRRRAIVVGVLVTLSLVLGGLAFLRPRQDPAMAFATLNALYASWKEPPPPAACRDASEASQLSLAATDLPTLSLLEHPGAEAAYLLARASWTQKKTKSEALEVALRCHHFAAAEGLAADIAIAENDTVRARAHLLAASTAAPAFLSARARLAGLMAQSGQLDQAAAEVDAIIAIDPDFAPAHFVKSALKGSQGDAEGVAAELCLAARLGSAPARQLATEQGLSCTK